MLNEIAEEEIAETVARFVEVFEDDDNPHTHAVGFVSEEGNELLWCEGSPATIIAVARKLEQIAKTIEHNKFGPVSLTIPEAAARTERNATTVRLALQDGSLHGSYVTSEWIVEVSCADAWNAGLLCEHRIATVG